MGEDVDIAMDSVTVRWLTERRQGSKGIGLEVEVGDMVQALEDGTEFEAGNVGVVTEIRLNVTGSHFFGEETVDIMWLGTCRRTGWEFRGFSSFFKRFKPVGYRATSCMSLARF